LGLAPGGPEALPVELVGLGRWRKLLFLVIATVMFGLTVALCVLKQGLYYVFVHGELEDFERVVFHTPTY
jgi:hypothetical protein